jgi:uncharacterized membrane protein
MSNPWHYMKNGAQAGPVTTDELKGLIASGAIKVDTLVWREGLATWVAANTQSELAGVVPPAAPPAPVAAPASTGGGPGVFTPDAADVEKNKVMGILAYLGILWLVPLLAAKDSPFSRYHCNQGLVLFLAAIGAWIATIVLDMVLVFIPFLGWFLMAVLHIGLILGVLALAIIGIINAANGVCKPLPLIGNRFTLIK